MNPQVIIFDLDGTLAESKQPLDSEMSGLLRDLLKNHYVAVVSGGSYTQFEKQFLNSLDANHGELLNLILLPTTGAGLYRFDQDKWRAEYQENLTDEEIQKIYRALYDAQEKFQFPIDTPYGQTIENRGTQVTLSPLGRYAPNDKKQLWDPHQEKRIEMIKFLAPLLPRCTLTIGGMTSIDITRAGIDKAYAINKLKNYLGIPLEAMLFVGDALFPGGNDEPAKKTNIKTVSVKSVQETKELIKTLLL